MMNCGNSYWIKGAWNSRAHAAPIRSMGNYGNCSFWDYENNLALLEVKQQHLLKTEWAGCRWKTTTLWLKGADNWAPPSWPSPCWIPKGGSAAHNNETNINSFCITIRFSFFFFCKHLCFLLCSQYLTELSKEYTETPLYIGDGVDWHVHGTKLLLGEGTRPSHYVCAFHSTKLFCC